MTTMSEYLLILVAQTPVHAGAGPSAQPVDCPIQKSVVTGFPVIRGSELKGALAQDIFQRCKGGAWEELRSLVFGSNERVGAFNVLDAHVLLFPVASLYGGYAFVTCPTLLHLFAERSRRAAAKSELGGLASQLADGFKDDGTGRCAIVETGAEVTSRVRGEPRPVVVLHPLLALKVIDQSDKLNEFARALESALSGLPVKLAGHVVVLSDDAAAYVIRRSLVMQPRVRLSYTTKTVSTGPWWEEAIPRFTVMHTSLSIDSGRAVSLRLPSGRAEGLKGVLDELTKVGKVAFRPSATGVETVDVELDRDRLLRLLVPSDRFHMFVGGDESVGRGLVTVVRVGP